MAKTTHTHRGHCQACGRIQAIDNGLAVLAKHGYTVPNGYFIGACVGGEHKPLEVERTLTDSHISYCLSTALRHDKRLGELKAGLYVPAEVGAYEDGGMMTYKDESGKMVTCERSYSSRRYQYKNPGQRFGERVAVMVKWEDASPYERSQGVKFEIAESESAARFFRSHADMLKKLAANVHGKPVQPVEVKRVLEAGDSVRCAAWSLVDDVVESITTKDKSTMRGYRSTRVAIITRKKDGKRLEVPVSSLRDFRKAGV